LHGHLVTRFFLCLGLLCLVWKYLLLLDLSAIQFFFWRVEGGIFFFIKKERSARGLNGVDELSP
jgi:hypothetical protein